MTQSLVGSLTANQTTPGAATPTLATYGGVRDPAGLLQGAQGTADGFHGLARALGLTDIVTGLMLASETWQSTPVDMTGSAHGLSAGFTSYVASVITDSPTVVLNAEVSQDGIGFARLVALTVGEGPDGLYTATIELPWRGFRWMRSSGKVGATAPTVILASSAGPKT